MASAYIIMADVKKSRDKDSKRLLADFKSIIEKINKKFREYLLSPLTITLGDEFQGVVSDMNSCVKIIINIEEEIVMQNADFQLRYVVKYGNIETSINKKIAYEMLGEGLTMARKKLEEFKKNRNLRVAIDIRNSENSILLENLFYLYTTIKDSWKQSDYYLIAEFIKLVKYDLVAKKLFKEPSLVWKREKTLMIKQYFAIKKSIIKISETTA
jgi:hypothetical protein